MTSRRKKRQMVPSSASPQRREGHGSSVPGTEGDNSVPTKDRTRASVRPLRLFRTDRRDLWVIALIAGLMVVAVAVRWQTNLTRSIWVDELHTYRNAERLAHGLPVFNERYHLGYFWTVSRFLKLGDSVPMLRLFNTLSYGVGIGLMGLLGALLGGRRWAAVAALLTATTPRVILAGGEARYYAPLFALGALSLICLELCRRGRSAWGLPLLVLSAAYSHSIHPAGTLFHMLVAACATVFAVRELAVRVQSLRAREEEGKPRLQWMPVALLSVMLLAACASAWLATPHIADIWKEQWGRVLEGAAERPDRLELTYRNFLFWPWKLLGIFALPSPLLLLSKVFWASLLVGGAILMGRRSLFWAVFLPSAFAVYLLNFYFIPARIQFAAKYAISGLPALLILATAALSEGSRLLGRRSSRSGTALLAGLLCVWAALVAPASRRSMTAEISHYNQLTELLRETATTTGMRPIVFSSATLDGSLRWHADRYIEPDLRPHFRNTRRHGKASLLQSLTSGRPVFWINAREDEEERRRVENAFSKYLAPTRVYDSPIFSFYDATVWEPRTDVILAPGRRTALSDDLIQKLASEGLMILGSGSWRTESDVDMESAQLGGRPFDPADPLVPPIDAPLLLRVEFGSGLPEHVVFDPVFQEGMIARPGGLADAISPAERLRPVDRGARPALLFEVDIWADYTLDIPGEKCALLLDFEEQGTKTCLYSVSVDGEPLGIVGTEYHDELVRSARHQRFLWVPGEWQGTRRTFRLTYLSESLAEGNRSWLHDVVLVRADQLSGQEDHDVSSRLDLLPEPAWFYPFPPAEESTLWKRAYQLRPDDTDLVVEHGEDESGGPVLRFLLSEKTPRSQLVFPGFPTQGKHSIYAVYEVRKLGAPRHSFGLFATFIDEAKHDVGVFRLTNQLQGQEDPGNWCRYEGLIPIPEEAAAVVFHLQVYRHPDDGGPPTPSGSGFEVRGLHIVDRFGRANE